MAQIFVTDREGNERPIELSLDGNPTLMEAIRNEGSFELAAMCGGMLSCSTCHVYIDEAWAAKIEPISDDELELIEASGRYQPTSRLSCQIQLEPAHDQHRVTIAPED